jgi:tetratricopeptide (TPR) repeat protein
MGLLRWLNRRWITLISIFVVAAGLVVWAFRPTPLDQWLRAEGFSHEAPIVVLRDWADGGRAPLTPAGFVNLFSAAELGVVLALMTALAVLVLLLPEHWRLRRLSSWLNRPLSAPGLSRIVTRAWVVMLLIAVVALYLGWEVRAWKRWPLANRYRLLAFKYELEKARCQSVLASLDESLARFDSKPIVLPDDSLTPAAQAAVRTYFRDSCRRSSLDLAERSAIYAELTRKYRRAAADPEKPVPPDPPLPKGRSGENASYSNWSNYVRANVDYDDLIGRYPDLYWAHERKAWILATSPDPDYRDGPRAVAEATRAAELSRWNNGGVLETLAAAYAERGDFAAALHWQEQAWTRPGASPAEIKHAQDRAVRDRLSLFKSGKPFRMNP